MDERFFVCMCVYVPFCLGFNFLLVIARSLKFSGMLNCNFFKCPFLSFAKSCIVLADEIKRDFAVSAYLKLLNCTNVTIFLFVGLIVRLFGVANKIILITIKISKMVILGKKVETNCFDN